MHELLKYIKINLNDTMLKQEHTFYKSNVITHVVIAVNGNYNSHLSSISSFADKQR